MRKATCPVLVVPAPGAATPHDSTQGVVRPLPWRPASRLRNRAPVRPHTELSPTRVCEDSCSRALAPSRRSGGQLFRRDVGRACRFVFLDATRRKFLLVNVTGPQLRYRAREIWGGRGTRIPTTVTGDAWMGTVSAFGRAPAADYSTGWRLVDERLASARVPEATRTLAPHRREGWPAVPSRGRGVPGPRGQVRLPGTARRNHAGHADGPCGPTAQPTHCRGGRPSTRVAICRWPGSRQHLRTAAQDGTRRGGEGFDAVRAPRVDRCHSRRTRARTTGRRT